MLIVVIGAFRLSATLRGFAATQTPAIRFGVPVVLLLGLGLLMLWILNRPKSADFLIATEGEMKKVSWSSRKEVVGSTKVVLVTTFFLAGLLFAVDLVFQLIFRQIGVIGG
jgi:preprotein translocase subunit SecE